MWCLSAGIKWNVSANQSTKRIYFNRLRLCALVLEEEIAHKTKTWSFVLWKIRWTMTQTAERKFMCSMAMAALQIMIILLHRQTIITCFWRKLKACENERLMYFHCVCDDTKWCTCVNRTCCLYATNLPTANIAWINMRHWHHTIGYGDIVIQEQNTNFHFTKRFFNVKILYISYFVAIFGLCSSRFHCVECRRYSSLK